MRPECQERAGVRALMPPPTDEARLAAQQWLDKLLSDGEAASSQQQRQEKEDREVAV